MRARHAASAAAAGMLFLLPACSPPPEPQHPTQSELNAERARRVQAEQRAVENEERTAAWQKTALIAGLSGCILLFVGAALGSMGKHDAG